MEPHDDIRRLIKEVSGVDLPPDAPPAEPVEITRPEDMPFYAHNKAVKAEIEKDRRQHERTFLLGMVMVCVPVGVVLWLLMRFL
jgi:hypothetical protein